LTATGRKLQGKANRETAMKKLDWNQLLGFEQVVSERDRETLTKTRIGGKIGGKGMEMIRGSRPPR
jgi:hypothetical protein